MSPTGFIIFLGVLTNACLSSPLTAYKNKSIKFELDKMWDECKVVEERPVFPKLYDHSKPLQPLNGSSFRHATFRSVDGHADYLRMLVGLRTNYGASIILSPEQEPKDTGFLFAIKFTQHHVGISAYQGRNNWLLITGRNNEVDLSWWALTAFHITMSNGTLQLRLNKDGSGAPWMEGSHERLKDIRYYGFGNLNTEPLGSARIYYDC